MMNIPDNVILIKSKALAIRVVNLYKYLCAESQEYILSKQLLRSGTSIGANVREASRAYSKKEFAVKMGIALKEADETAYWLEILSETGYLTDSQFDSIYADNDELIKLLVAIVKTSRAD